MDKDTFTEKVFSMEKGLYHVARSMLSCQEDCEDALQETILKAYAGMEQGEGADIGQTDLPSVLSVTGVKYQDGTVIDQEYQVMNFGYSGNDGAFTITQRFSAVVDTQEVIAVLMGPQRDEIDLGNESALH